MPKIALYAGSFDPPTNGHVWMIEKAATMFDQLVVAIGTNSSKQPLLDLPTRIDLLESCTRHLENVEIRPCPNEYTVNLAAETGAEYLIRGIRSASDFEMERTIQLMNDDISRILKVPSPTSVFLMPPRDLAEISSSLVKQLIGRPAQPFPGWENVAAKYVPAPVLLHFVSLYSR